VGAEFQTFPFRQSVNPNQPMPLADVLIDRGWLEVSAPSAIGLPDF
jgi:hypothetical protein